MQRCSLLISAVLLTASAAFAQDGGTADAGTAPTDAGAPAGDAGAAGCGDVTLQGECAGNLVRYCATEDNELVEYDCGGATAALDDDFYPEGVTATCEEITAEYGVDCAIATGGPCVFNIQDQPTPVFCTDANACVISLDETGDALCTTGVPACTPADPFAPTCSGDLLIFGCFPSGQPVAYDCASLGGECSAGSCANIPEGGACGDGFDCASGLECDQAAQECVPEGSGGEGEGEGEGGEGEGETECAEGEILDRGECVPATEPGPCSASDIPASTLPASFALLAALTGLIAVRRRRG